MFSLVVRVYVFIGLKVKITTGPLPPHRLKDRERMIEAKVHGSNQINNVVTGSVPKPKKKVSHS